MAVIIVAAALLIGLASRPKADGSSGAVPEAANALRIPIQGAVGSVVEWMRGIYGYIYRYDKLLAENESLRRQLAEAQEQVRSSQDALEENTRLRTMLGYLEKNTTFKTEAAMITSWDASNWTSAFTISKGTDNGIEQGDCVITESGMLVGQVYEVGKNYASVRTVIDVNMDAGVLVGESSIAAMIVGDYALMKEGCCKLSYFTDDRWKVGHENGTMPKAGANDMEKFYISSASVLDGSYFKIKQIQLGYTLPKKLLKSIKVENLRIYTSLDDFFVFTSYPGLDPEVTGVRRALGVDKGSYPTSRKVVAGISLTF